MTSPQTAYLLINLGTPRSPHTADVRRYLAEFLMDPRVIDIPYLARFLLIHGIILRTRPQKSAQAYQKIWTERGSPLKFHTEDTISKLSKDLSHVFYAMRYGEPSIRSVLEKLRNFSKIKVLPLYPQFAWSSSASCIEKVKEEAKKLGLKNEIQFLPAFYKDFRYIEALTNQTKKHLDAFKPDHVLVSYHGLPERQLAKADPRYTPKAPQHCLSQHNCCETSHPIHMYCYRHQCFQTTYALAQSLGWSQDFYTLSFQSRLGRTPWIQPFTDLKIQEFAKSGKIKKLAVVCPSFVSDCLETLEEIGIRAKEEFESLCPGGQLELIPCLNSNDDWIRALKGLLLSESSPDFAKEKFYG